MSLPKQASIRVHNNQSEWRFEWSGFDGDDCFQNFRLAVTEQGTTRHFYVGAAVVWTLRWLTRFFEDQTLERAQGHIPVFRCGQDYRLVIKTGSRQEEFYLKSPEVLLDREFLRQYEGNEET